MIRSLNMKAMGVQLSQFQFSLLCFIIGCSAVISDRPVVKCTVGSSVVIEGENLVVQCLAHSNPPPTVVRIYIHNEILKHCSQSPCNLKLKSSRNDYNKYTCIAYNQIGNGNTCQAIVKILYPPAVSVVIVNDTTLRCSATGEPNNAIYMTWQHKSEVGTVTHYNGSEFLKLCTSCKRYAVNGLYRCAVSNGIRDANGNDVSFGNVSVLLKGIPEILPTTNKIQYGKYKQSGKLEVLIYSTSSVNISTLSKNGKLIGTSGHLTMDNISRFKHRAIYRFKFLHGVDFDNYTFEVINDQGAINFTVSLLERDDDIDGIGLFRSVYFIIVISIGSGILGAFFSLLLYRFCKRITTVPNGNTSLTNTNAESVVKYSNIDIINKQKMERESSHRKRSRAKAQKENSNLNNKKGKNMGNVERLGVKTDDSSDRVPPSGSYINLPAPNNDKYILPMSQSSHKLDNDQYISLMSSADIEDIEESYYDMPTRDSAVV